MSEEKNCIPKRRFKEFQNSIAWEQRKLSEFVDKAVDNRGKTPPLDENGTHPLIEVAALGGVHPDYTKVEKYLNDNSFENNLRAYIKEGDILFTTVGSIGLVSLMDSREEAAIAQNIVAFRAKENYVPEYLYALFSNEDNHYKATRIVMGAVQPSIKVSQLVDVEYMLTENVEEQTKIGAYFSNLDNLITLHQRKLEKIKAMKAAYLTEMFPQEGENVPKRRFVGFTDDWEQRKLGEIYKFQYGQFNNNPSNGGQYPVYGANGVIGGYTEFNTEDSIIIGHMGEYAGIVLWGDGKHFVTYNGIITTPRDNKVYSRFGYYLLQQKNIRQICGGSGQPFLSYEMLNKLQSSIPVNIDEQIQIGAFFYNLDNLITLHQRKLDKLQNIKKAYLNEMFI